MSTPGTDAFQLMLQQLRNSFLEDMPERLGRLDQLLLTMEKSGVDHDSFNEFYRIVHSLKGSGGTFGLHIVTTICHQLEDLLNTTDGGTKFIPLLIAISLEYVDLLRTVLTQARAGDTSFPQVEESLDVLHRRLIKKQHSVLIVSDSKLLMQICLQTMAELRVHPVMAEDGLVALHRALTEPFDLLVTANEIPVLNGVALIGALKLSVSKNRNLKTILVTSDKKMAACTHRSADSDYIVAKDANLARNLVGAVKRALSTRPDQ